MLEALRHTQHFGCDDFVTGCRHSSNSHEALRDHTDGIAAQADELSLGACCTCSNTGLAQISRRIATCQYQRGQAAFSASGVPSIAQNAASEAPTLTCQQTAPTETGSC